MQSDLEEEGAEPEVEEGQFTPALYLSSRFDADFLLSFSFVTNQSLLPSLPLDTRPSPSPSLLVRPNLLLLHLHSLITLLGDLLCRWDTRRRLLLLLRKLVSRLSRRVESKKST